MHRTFVYVPAALAIIFGTFHLEAENESPAPAAGETAAMDANRSNEQFGPYEFLIGEWDVKATDDGPVAAIIRVRWGPNNSYIWYTRSLLFNGREEPHLVGMLVWKTAHKNLDMLFSIVRHITAVYGAGTRAIGMPPIGPEGATAHFRETYKRSAPTKFSLRPCAKPSTVGLPPSPVAITW
jgi:hypothetical protein